MSDYPHRKITVEPGLPSNLIRNTLEGAMLWSMLRLNPETEPSTALTEISCNVVDGAGIIAYSLGGGTAKEWIELAKENQSDFGKAALAFFSKGDDFHCGVFDLNRCVDTRGINPLTLSKILQSILINHAEKVETDHFVVRISPSDIDNNISFGAAFITSRKVDHLNVEQWIARKKRDHKHSEIREPGLVF